MRSLYVHFPFCETKCHYCDFYSLGRERTRTGDADVFEAALRAEAERQAPLLSPELETIFFGGGTPSMTPPASMARALEPLWRRTRPAADVEWTMEANPSSIDAKRMKEYRALGVNRVSMGVQSMTEALLQKLGRVHDEAAVPRALEAVFGAGFTNVSCDLLCGVPGQALADLDRALARLITFPLTHLSCYLLTLPKHHRMFGELPDEDRQLEHLLYIDEKMRAAGFEHYEISNYARPGKRAQHNLRYWQGAPYLALGPSAHSFDGDRRWKNVSSLHKYGQLLGAGETAIEWTETLTSEQRELEKWMLHLRLIEGFPKAWLDTEARRRKADALAGAGLLEPSPADGGRLRLTARGFALSDQVIASLA